MSKLWKWLGISVTAGVLIFVVVTVGKKASPAVSTASYPGYQVPQFTLQTAKPGEVIKLGQYLGKPLLINFWASWCPPCKAETPDLVKAYQEFGSKVQFIGVNATAQDSSANAVNFIKHYNIPYPVAFDTTNQVVNQFSVSGLPTSIFVNAKGMVVARVEGGMTAEVLKADLGKIAN